jgi:hypothetical protein
MTVSEEGSVLALLRELLQVQAERAQLYADLHQSAPLLLSLGCLCAAAFVV